MRGGALTCGDLDLVMEVDKPLVSAGELNRVMLGNPPRVSVYTGNPNQNSSMGPFAEAVLVWEPGKDWRAALAGIEPDASAFRFGRPADVIPFRREQVKGSLDWVEAMLDLHARKDLTWRFVPLDEVSEQVWSCPCMTGHSVTLRLENLLAGGTRVASGISRRYADATRCSGRTQWPGSAAPFGRRAWASTKRNHASSF